MPQGENLSVQRCAGSKSLPNRRKERANDREHGVSTLSRRPFKFNWINENRVFGRHSWRFGAGQKKCQSLLSAPDGVATSPRESIGVGPH
jgi:hypothetical protein